MAVCCCQFDEFSSKRIRTTSTRTGPDRGEHWFKPIDGPDCDVAREIHINCIGYAALFTKLTRTDFEAGTDCLISTSFSGGLQPVRCYSQAGNSPREGCPAGEANPRTLTAHRKTLCSVQARFHRRLSVRYLAVATRRRGRIGPQQTAASVVEEELV